MWGILSERWNLLTDIQRHQTVSVSHAVQRAALRAGQVSVLWRGQVPHAAHGADRLQVSPDSQLKSVNVFGTESNSILNFKRCFCEQNRENDSFFVWSCPNGHVQPSCYTCLNYCTHGQCSVDTQTLLPQCKWDLSSILSSSFITCHSNPNNCLIFVSRCYAGWDGYRCETAASSVNSPDSTSNRKSHTFRGKVLAEKTETLVPLAQFCLLSHRHRLHRGPSASTALAGSAGGRRHLLVQAENARVSPNVLFLSTVPRSFFLFICSLLLLSPCYIFNNHLFPVSQVSVLGQISFSLLAVTW